MKQNPSFRSAFFNPRVLIGFAVCAIVPLLALLAFALYPGGNAFARQDQSSPPQSALNNVTVLQARPTQEPPGAPEVSVTSLEPSGSVDMTALGIRPVWAPQAVVTSPDGSAMGTGNAFTNVTSDIVNQSVTAAFATLSYGWTPGESVQYYLNGTLANTFTAGATYGYLGVTVNSGAGFGFITIYQKGLTSLKESGTVVQVAPTGPYMPGVACAPHAVNTAGASPALLLFAAGYPASASVQRYRNGVASGTTTTGTTGTFFILLAPANNGNTSAIYSVDQIPGVAGKMSGVTVEERSDAGTPPVGDQNLSRAFIDRPVLDSAVGGTFAIVGEGFQAGETVNITGSSTGSVTADANGAATVFLTAPAGAAIYSTTLTGVTSARVARASAQAHADVTNRRGLIVAPSMVSPGGNVLVMADRLPANDTGQIFLDGVLQGTATTNANGFATFTLPKPTPGGTPGTLVVLHEVGWIATGGTGDAQATGLLLGPPPGPTPTPGPTATPTVTPIPTPTSTPGPNGCTWGSGPVVPIPILDNAVTSIGGFLYSFGGVSTSTIANAYEFDGTTWTAIAPLPVALEYPSAVNDGTNAYILGGVASGLATTTLYRYNVGLNTYTTLAPFTVATWNQAAVYLNGKIYKFAGTNDTPASVAALEIYDIGSNTWTTGAAYPVATSFPMAFVQGNFIYAGGGIDAATAVETAKTYRYDPVADTWDDASIADLPATRWGGASSFGNCCTGGGVFAGGYVTGAISFTAISWDLGTNTWSSTPNMLGERSRMGGAILNGTFYVVGGRSNASPSFVGTNDNQKLSCPGAPTPSPTPALVSVSGTVGGCTTGATPIPVANVLMSLTGPSPAPRSTQTDSSGNYTLSGLTAGGTYTVTPTKTAHVAGSAGISTVDVIAVQRHFLVIGTPLSGCRLAAADVNGVGGINTVDVIAIQRFFLGLATGTANTGKYQFTPASDTFVASRPGSQPDNLINRNYNAIVFGDVATPFVPRPGGSSQDSAGDDMLSYRDVPATVAAVALPDVAAGQGNFTAAVGSSEIDATNKLVGFQGDFTFDERVVTFQSQPVSNAGLTGGNWNVSGNVLAGPGPIRTLRISAYSNDFKPLSGSGTLFNLNMTRVSKAAQSTPLIWAAAPDGFIFIDADLNTQKAGSAVAGSVGR